MPLPVVGDVSIHEQQSLGRDLQGLSSDQTETLMSGLEHDGDRTKLTKFLNSFQLLSTGEHHAAHCLPLHVLLYTLQGLSTGEGSMGLDCSAVQLAHTSSCWGTALRAQHGGARQEPSCSAAWLAQRSPCSCAQLKCWAQ